MQGGQRRLLGVDECGELLQEGLIDGVPSGGKLSCVHVCVCVCMCMCSDVSA